MTDKTTHTPGPWKIGGSVDGKYSIWGEESEPLALVGSDEWETGNHQPPGRGQANARLIAAAPYMESRIAELEADNTELLEAAEAALQWLALTDQERTGAADYLRAAIAKTTGEVA